MCQSCIPEIRNLIFFFLTQSAWFSIVIQAINLAICSSIAIITRSPERGWRKAGQGLTNSYSIFLIVLTIHTHMTPGIAVPLLRTLWLPDFSWSIKELFWRPSQIPSPGQQRERREVLLQFLCNCYTQWTMRMKSVLYLPSPKLNSISLMLTIFLM